MFGGDLDAGMVAGASAGVEFQIEPGFAVKVILTGLAADTSFETDAGDLDVDAIWSAGIGLTFDF